MVLYLGIARAMLSTTHTGGMPTRYDVLSIAFATAYCPLGKLGLPALLMRTSHESVVVFFLGRAINPSYQYYYFY